MRSIWLACLLLLSSCSNLDAVKEQSLKEVKLAKPDEDILANLEQYEVLHQFVNDNLSELLKDQKLNHKGGSPHGDHATQKVGNPTISCYSFNPVTQAKDSIETKENTLMMELKNQVKSLGKTAPLRIEICSDGRVLFTLKFVENYQDFYIEHKLIWNRPSGKSSDYWIGYKDLKINNNIIYRIGAVYTG
jgi:hypothetical protein